MPSSYPRSVAARMPRRAPLAPRPGVSAASWRRPPSGRSPWLCSPPFAGYFSFLTLLPAFLIRQLGAGEAEGGLVTSLVTPGTIVAWPLSTGNTPAREFHFKLAAVAEPPSEAV